MKTLSWIAASLLLAHEIDSGYWHEWELFKLPGGADTFVILNVGLCLVILLACRQIWTERHAVAWSATLAIGGIVTFGIHAAFLAAGDPHFKSVVSLGILVLLLLVSLALLFTAWRSAHRAP